MTRLYFAVPREATAPFQTCVYCGVPLAPEQTKAWPGTCALHKSLPKSDPAFMLDKRMGAK